MRRTPPAVAVVLVALAGCGGGDEGDGQKKDTVTVGRNQPIAFGASEYSFEPKHVTVNSGDLHIAKDGQDLGGTPIFGTITVTSRETHRPGEKDAGKPGRKK